jgi:hypothetical protein
MQSAQHDIFEIPESLVAEKTGLTRAELRERRVANPDFAKKTAAGWLWSHAGLAALERSIASGVGAVAAPEPVTLPKRQVLTVVRRRTARVLHAVRDDEPYDPRAPLCIWLPRPLSHLFLPKMRVAVTPRADRNDLFDYAGHPENEARRWPRRPGNW